MSPSKTIGEEKIEQQAEIKQTEPTSLYWSDAINSFMFLNCLK